MTGPCLANIISPPPPTPPLVVPVRVRLHMPAHHHQPAPSARGGDGAVPRQVAVPQGAGGAGALLGAVLAAQPVGTPAGPAQGAGAHPGLVPVPAFLCWLCLDGAGSMDLLGRLPHARLPPNGEARLLRRRGVSALRPVLHRRPPGAPARRRRRPLQGGEEEEEGQPGSPPRRDGALRLSLRRPRRLPHPRPLGLYVQHGGQRGGGRRPERPLVRLQRPQVARYPQGLDRLAGPRRRLGHARHVARALRLPPPVGLPRRPQLVACWYRRPDRLVVQVSRKPVTYTQMTLPT